MRRLGPVAAVVFVLLAGGCTASGAHRASGTSSAAGATGPTQPPGSDCLRLLREAEATTLASPSFTLTQDAWREHPVASSVPGGGAAVITYQAPDRFHVTPTVTGATHRAPVEQIFIGPRAWQGSAKAGWVAYHTDRPTDPLRWLKAARSASRAWWASGSCRFRATVSEGDVDGRVGLDPDGRLATLAMTLTTGGTTIRMSYRLSKIGSSPDVRAPSI